MGRERPAVRAVAVLALCLIPAALWGRGIAEKDDRLTVGAVQFAVSEEVYASPENFRSAVESMLDEVDAEAAERDLSPDLVVFPEYTSAFLGLSVLSDEEKTELRENPAGSRTVAIKAILETHHDMLDAWKDISRKRPYAILAGSALVPDSLSRLHGMSWVFSNGEIIWTGEKQQPGPLERDIFDMPVYPGASMKPFIIDGYPVGVTIHHDTFREGAAESMEGIRMWIDIKASHLPYDMDIWDRGLTSLLAASSAERGLTVSLSGDLLGLSFTGPTEYHYDGGPIAGTDPRGENAVLLVSMIDEEKED